MISWHFEIVLFNKEETCLKLIGIMQLQCPGFVRNADDWAVVSVSALFGARLRVSLSYILDRLISEYRPSIFEFAIFDDILI